MSRFKLFSIIFTIIIVVTFTYPVVAFGSAGTLDYILTELIGCSLCSVNTIKQAEDVATIEIIHRRPEGTFDGRLVIFVTFEDASVEVVVVEDVVLDDGEDVTIHLVPQSAAGSQPVDEILIVFEESE